jgi:pyruvate/2-oxoglutarate dehydrogenase complex dihydrolipoamide dehydrogenase (E3) component
MATTEDSRPMGHPDHDATSDRRAPGSRHDVAVIGAGSAAEALVARLAGHDLDVVVFEPRLVGGECPFVACMPSKAMLHDVASERPWDAAVERRDQVVDHLDDSGHAEQLERHGATLVRARARFVGSGLLEADGHRHEAEHVVIATGARPVVPDIEGLADLGDGVWTSDDALTAAERPARIAVIGGGPIGCELAEIFSGFGSEVHLIDLAERAFPDLPAPIGDIVDEGLAASGVRVSRGREVTCVERREGSIVGHLDDATSFETDRVLVASGRRARLEGLGLERLGLDPEHELPLSPNGRVTCAGSVWAIGDVAGRGQYTHLANHHARVVADHLVGSRTRRFDDVVTPACIFTNPPLMMVGPRPGDLARDDVAWIDARLSDIARSTTDEFGDGYLYVGVDRATRRVVAAHGAGTRFDELAATFVMVIDAETTVDRLARSMLPFPTVSELVAVVAARAIDVLDG